MKIKILLLILIIASCSSGFAIPPSVDNHIKVDQFGYRCSDQKIAVISNPQTGFNSGSPFAATTAANQYQVRDWATNAVVYTGTITAWNAGATHGQSGDIVWWFDFSSYTTPGTYYVFDIGKNVGSYKFEIRDDIYADVLKHAMRSYYYQRCGTAKAAPYAGTGWTDVACHKGARQDTDCRLYNNQVAGTSKDLSGGWHDAGDYNKYVNFTWNALTDLLLAYEENPSAWKDNYNIPESGNSIPDILDEIKYELDWILKMQNPDGSVLCVIGGGGASPPSSDAAFRVYGPATTSASFTAASVLALGAIQFKSLGIPAMTTYANTLQTAAINAWNWGSANNVTFYNSGVIAAGEQEFGAGSYTYDLTMRKLGAACFLYALTGTAAYKTYFESNYTTAHLIAWSYAYPFETTTQDVLLYYAKASGVTAAVVTNIQNKFSTSVISGNADNLPAYTSQADAYRAYLATGNYTWGSNSTKGYQANMLLTENVYNLSPANATNLKNAASGYLHYMHGVNPMAMVYVSNMNNYGAENSVSEFYNSWFADGSALWDRVGTSTYGPAPGFVPGGPNAGWSLDPCCPSGCGSAANNALCVNQIPPSGQPTQKSFKDWNASWPQNSWSVTENGIYYNASYARLVSKYTGGAGTCGTLALQDEPKINEDQNTNGFKINVYPNPFDHHTHLEVTSFRKEKIKIRVLSILGNELLSQKEFFSNEVIELGDELPKGVLILEIRTNKDISTLKLIKN
jgi:endoglucanase